MGMGVMKEEKRSRRSLGDIVRLSAADGGMIGVRNQEVQKEYETYKDKAEGSAEPEKSHNRWD